MHASPLSFAAISESSRTRLGSPSALKARASRSASSAPTTPSVTGAQQATRSMTGSDLPLAMPRVCHTH